MNSYISFPVDDGFSPSDISGLEFWLDADDASTYDVDGSGKVTEWRDKSSDVHVGTVNSLNSTTPAVASVGGRSMIAFSPLQSNRFDFPDANDLDPGTAQCALFVVYQKNGANRASIISKGEDKPRWEIFINSDVSNAGRLGIAMADSVDLIFNSATDHDFADGTSRGAYWIRDSGGDYPHFEILTAGESELIGSPLEGTVVGDITGSEALHVGARTAGGGSPFYMDGNIAEIVFYVANLTTQNRLDIHNYLALKWGL